MTRDELSDRVLELFPPLAEVEPWDWDETDEGEPVVMVESPRPSPASRPATWT